MKKIIVLVLLSALLMTSCSVLTENNAEKYSLSDNYPAYFEYSSPVKRDITLSRFAVDNDGSLYTLCYDLGNASANSASSLVVYDMDGNSEVYEMDFLPEAFAVCDGVIYCKYDYSLYRFVPETGEKTEICALQEFTSVSKIKVSGDTVYVFGISNDRLGLEGEYSDELGRYYYNGEKLISVDINSGEITESSVQFPIAFSVYGESCIVYTADKDGYYFCNFDGGDISRHNIIAMNDFDLYDYEHYVFTADDGINIGNICAGTLNGDDGISQLNNLLDDGSWTDSVITVGGYTFYCFTASDGESKFYRIRNSEYIKKNNKISFISTEFDLEAPFGCGYTIEYEKMTDDAFALSVLSQDSRYDMYMVNSFDECASNIRDKGSFYPLNEVPGVREYLEKCFPYINNAAVNSDGEIWMLPINVDVPVIIYNKSVCEYLGIDFTESMTLEQFVSVCEKAYQSDYRNNYDVLPYTFTKNLLTQYMSYHDSFNTDEFRNFSQLAKAEINISDTANYPVYFNTLNNALMLFDDNAIKEQFLFSYMAFNNTTEWLSTFDGFSFCEPPGICGDDKNIASCTFITVNPMSDNLEAVLDYISSLCEYLSGKDNEVMFTDGYGGAASESMYAVYSSAEVGFNVSEELVFDLYINYLAGEISLEEFISEADRKLSAYMNE